MDSKLAVCRGRNISLKGVLCGSACAAYILVGYLLQKLGKTFRVEHGSFPPGYSPGTPKDSSTLKILHYDRDVELTGHRLAMRQILALPVFRVSRVGYPLSSLARRYPPSSYIRPMGAARVGLERFPQHKRKLGGCGVVARGPGPWRIVQWFERGR